MARVVGCSAEVTTLAGECYDGVFVSYNSNLELLLEEAHLIEEKSGDNAISKYYDLLVIPSDKV